jgi:hypothetical protein
VSTFVNVVVMIKSKAFMRRLMFSYKKYLIEVRTCPTKTAFSAYYGEYKLSQFCHQNLTKKKSISAILTRTSTEAR